MPRYRMPLEELLASIATSRGVIARRMAERLLSLAEDVGAEAWSRQSGVSIRMAGLPASSQKWLTLFVISADGTFYVNWLQRWGNVGTPSTVATAYLRTLVDLLGENVEQHPVQYRHAPSMADVQGAWQGLEPAIRKAARAIRQAVLQASRRTSKAQRAASESDTALEGLAYEAKVSRRKRNRALREKALSRSRGVCECCGTDFASVLGGRGWRVLQVHHKAQLRLRDAPTPTHISDLAIVCANCHLLLHYDPAVAIAVEDLRSMLSAAD